MEAIVEFAAHAGVELVELAGIVVLLMTAAKAFMAYLRGSVNVRLELAQGIALALEFKLGGEVLRTVIVRDWTEMGILGAVIILRGVLTLLLHWEIRMEESRGHLQGRS